MEREGGRHREGQRKREGENEREGKGGLRPLGIWNFFKSPLNKAHFNRLRTKSSRNTLFSGKNEL